MMGFIRKLMTLQKLFKILKFIDPKKLQGINDILEQIYPGIKDEIERLVKRVDIHAMSKTLDYIKTHGGAEKMAEYYNNADKKGQDEMNYRTVDDWRTFVRRQHEANKDVLLGILDEVQKIKVKNEGTDEEESSPNQTDNQPDNGVQYPFPQELISELYDYDNVVFKHISSKSELGCIIKREAHKEKLVECSGKKVLVYHLLWRLRTLLPDEQREDWIKDIAAECGYKVDTISKKYKDETNMKPGNVKLLHELSSLFDSYDTKM